MDFLDYLFTELSYRSNESIRRQKRRNRGRNVVLIVIVVVLASVIKIKERIANRK